MQFDDRLATVLRARTASMASRRTQLRQLLDLLGTMPSESGGEAVDAAFDAAARLTRDIPDEARAAIIGEPGVRLRSARLVALLAAGDPRSAAAAVTSAELTPEAWLDLIPALPARARSVLSAQPALDPQVRALLARLGAGPVALPAAASVPEAAEPARANDGIGALVRRIEAFRKNRDTAAALRPGEPAELALDDRAPPPETVRVGAFDFVTDRDLRIVRCDPGVAPMAIGLALASRDRAAPVTAAPALIAAAARRQPIRRGALEIVAAPALAGAWLIDAAPWFDPLGGRFIGYRGRARRPVAALPEDAIAGDSAAEKMRQLLHELRTPVNAIQGFAEVIQQQLFGPTPHEYRALAATIASDAARMLAGFEELERLARLDSGVAAIEAGTSDLGALVEATIAQLASHTAPRSSGFTLRRDEGSSAAAIAPHEAERLIWRLLATLAGAAAPGEVLRLRLRRREGWVRLTLDLPAALAAREGDALFAATPGAVPQALAAGMFGAGFALRLATAEARGAGGTLERREARLRLSLPASVAPGLTGPAPANSQGTPGSGRTNSG